MSCSISFLPFNLKKALTRSSTYDKTHSPKWKRSSDGKLTRKLLSLPPLSRFAFLTACMTVRWEESRPLPVPSNAIEDNLESVYRDSMLILGIKFALLIWILYWAFCGAGTMPNNTERERVCVCVLHASQSSMPGDHRLRFAETFDLTSSSVEGKIRRSRLTDAQ